MDATKQAPRFLGVATVATGLVALRHRLLSSGTRTTSTWGPRWLAIGLAGALGKLANAMGVQFESDTIEKWHADPSKRLDPERQYLICWHPHGALTFCAAFFTSKLAAQSTTREAPGPKRWFVGIANLLFRFPFLGEFMALVNARPVTQRMAEEILLQGHSYAIQPGGIPEQVLTDHRREMLVFPPNLGFCRLALKYGVPLVPIYAFGENQVFTTYEWSRQATSRLHKSFGIAVPLVNPIPNKTGIHMKWGRPVEVGSAEEQASDTRVQQIFAQYLLELGRLFAEHCYHCLPSEVAALGLTVVWRGHSKSELESLLAREALDAGVPKCLHAACGLPRTVQPVFQSKL